MTNLFLIINHPVYKVLIVKITFFNLKKDYVNNFNFFKQKIMDYKTIF